MFYQQYSSVGDWNAIFSIHTFWQLNFFQNEVKLVALHGEEDLSKVKTTCGDTMWKSLNWVVISSEKNWRLQLNVSISMLWSSSDSPDDDQIILIETSSCNLQFFSELITTQLRDFHMVSPQVVFTYYLFFQNW